MAGLMNGYVAGDIANVVLDHYFKGAAHKQTIQEKPLMRILDEGKKSFPGGQGNVKTNVQGTFMSDSAGFLTGFSQDDALTFSTAANVLQVSFAWKECHAGLMITETELKQGGISITDDQVETQHELPELITNILQNRVGDYSESWTRAVQDMFWRDGSQDAKIIRGLRSILVDDPTTGTTGGISRVTYKWWQHRSNFALTPSEQNQTLTKFLRYELRQLRRWGGRPNRWLAGSDFMAALESEYQAKGQYTITGFTREKNDLGMAKISLLGLGTCEYDPSLDDMGLSKRCVVFDDKRIYYAPMESEDDKKRRPTRPYNYFVWMQSMTKTGVMVVTQLNCHGVYGIA